MRRLVLIIGVFLSCWGCAYSPKEETIIGAWKVDSTFTYYNGFTYVERESGSDWATYVYEENGIMKEIKYGSFQSYHFDWTSKDSIKLQPTIGGDPFYFKVMGLNADRMALKKSKAPIFSGKNQERYEIRYFSRTTLPASDQVPFKDPRK